MGTVRTAWTVRGAGAVAEIAGTDEVFYSVRECGRCGGRLEASHGLLGERWVCTACGKKAH
jgi:ribosomal protein S27AE